MKYANSNTVIGSNQLSIIAKDDFHEGANVYKKICDYSFNETFIDDDFSESVSKKEKSKCIGMLLNLNIWLPEDAAKAQSPDFFIAVLGTLLKLYPEIFVTYDPEREIVKQKDSWDCEYFEKQIDFLRHNFSLERVSHVIEVYTIVFWNKMLKEKKCNGEVSIPALNIISGLHGNMSTLSSLILIIVIVLIIIVIYYLNS